MKIRSSLLRPTLVVVLTVNLLPCAATVTRSQSIAPVPAPTIIRSAPYTISGSGFYQLGADLTYNGNGTANDAIITVNAPNVTLDFGGHYISGPSANPATGLYGVYANGVGNLTLQNGTVSHCLEGIYVTSGGGTPNSLNQTIRNLLVTHCYFVGIDLRNSSASQVSNCQVSFIGGTTGANAGFATGISIGTPGLGCQVNNNTVSSITAGDGYGYGLYAYGASAAGNAVDTVTGSEGAYGIAYSTLALSNKISNCATGLYGPAKYANNYTYNCPTSFGGGGIDAGGNN